MRIAPLVYIYNSKQVNRKEVPTNAEELTQPKRSGKMAVDDESYDWLAAPMDYYGEAKGLELAAKVGRQQLQPRRGTTLVTQLIAAGEFILEIDGHCREAIVKKKAGALIDYVFPQPFVPVKSLVPIYTSSHAPHPHAAALMADFLMSKRGQDIRYGHGRWVGHKSIIGKGTDNIGDPEVVIPPPGKMGRPRSGADRTVQQIDSAQVTRSRADQKVSDSQR